MSSSSTPRCVTARSTPGCTVARRARRPARQERRSPPRAMSGATSSATKFVSTAVGIDGQPGVGEAEREPLRASVVVCEPLDVVVERIDARRGDDPRLPHRAAEEVLARRARLLDRSAGPASSAPSGQPRPFEQQSVTVSAGRRTRLPSSPLATEAFRSRAPSRWKRRSSSSHDGASSSIWSSGQTRPPALRCGVLEHDELRRAAVDRRRAAAARSCSGVRRPATPGRPRMTTPRVDRRDRRAS